MYNANIEDIIKELRELSLDISSRKVTLHKKQSIPYASMSELDSEQAARISDIFLRRLIMNGKEAYELFRKNNMVFFYGYDPTYAGMCNQLFVYDIAKEERVDISMWRTRREFNMITTGHRHLHGIFDIIEKMPGGAQTIDANNVVFHDDTREAFKDIEFEIGDGKPANVADLLLRNQWPYYSNLDLNQFAIDYKNYYIIHEGAHLMFDDAIDRDHYIMEDPSDLSIYNSDTERFAILSQLAYSSLPLYALYNFLPSLVKENDYSSAMNGIIKGFITIINTNLWRFPQLKGRIIEQPNSSEADIFRFLCSLRENQTRYISKLMLEKEYKPLICRDKNRTHWVVDLESQRLAVLDADDNVLNYPNYLND